MDPAIPDGQSDHPSFEKAQFEADSGDHRPVSCAGRVYLVMLSTESLLSISFTSSLSRYGGDLAVGAMTIINSVSQLVSMPVQGICQGGQPIISYNFGAGKDGAGKKSILSAVSRVHNLHDFVLGSADAGAADFAGIFTGDAELVSYATWAMRIYMAGIFSNGFQMCCQQSFMALGQAKISLLLACLRKLIC